VNLPEIQVVGAQAAQRFIELPHRDLRVASMRADLGHQENRTPAVGDGASHPSFALAVVILPGVVEEVDPGVDGFVNDADGFGNGLRLAEVIAAEPDHGDAIRIAPEPATIDRAG
jgi:hypothetical protein